jgi:nucleoid-associated protein YgaU
MDRGARTVLAVVVLLGGIATAMLFRHPASPSGTPDGGTSERFVLRKQIGSVADAVPQLLPQVPRGVESPPSPRPAPAPPKAATLLAPMDPGRPPPMLASTYPHARDEEASGGSEPRSTGLASLPPAGPGLRTHRVADGDTLASLAARYLGSRDRAQEIFEANRETLGSPDLLPIGVQLRIPPPGPRAATSLDSIRQAPLAPIPAAL